MKNIFLFSLLLTLGLIQLSCKKKDTAPTPATIDQNAIMQPNGSISGTINTTSGNSAIENFSYSFSYSGGPYIYAAKKINFSTSKSLDALISGLDQVSGSLTFGAVDSTKSAPTSWSFSLSATNPNTTGTFLFSTGGPNITQTNSSISGYSFTNNLMSLKITTNAGYLGANGKTAAVVTNFSMPVVNGIYRMAAK